MEVEGHLESMKGDYAEGVAFEKIDISQDLSEARKYGVQATPTVIIIDNATGDVLSATAGPREKTFYQSEIEEALN